MMVIVVVIMRQRRTVMKDMKAMMIMRMPETPVMPMTNIEAVDGDGTDDADGRNERYCDAVGFFRVTYYKDSFISVFQDPLRSG